jgi:peroxiredoxin
MLGPGDRIPDATVWVGPRERHTIADIVEDGPVLLLFYLFDWTST